MSITAGVLTRGALATLLLSSTTAAEYEYVGVGPTPAPFHFATERGGV